jgi:hypothetical protein
LAICAGTNGRLCAAAFRRCWFGIDQI